MNEGHPALWYLALWLGSRIWDDYGVLKIVSFLAGLSMVCVTFLASPFPLLHRSLFIFGAFPLHHFSVVARPYGLAALLILLLAMEYARKAACNPWRVGVYNALLANTSIYGAIVACAFVLVPLAGTPKTGYSQRSYLAVVTLLTGVGVALCLYTIWPTSDNLVMERQGMQVLQAGYVNLAAEVLRSLYAIISDQQGWTGYILTGYGLQTKLSQLGYTSLGTVTSVVGLLAILALFIRWPRVLIAFTSCFVASGLFSNLMYPASNVHIAVIGIFLFALLWITWSRYYSARTLYWPLLTYFLGISLFFHASDGVHTAWRDLHETYSSSKVAGGFLTSMYPDAIVIGEPDVFGESLPYYVDNPIYLVRESRFARWVRFERPFNRTVRLGELMNVSAQLQRTTGKTVLVSLPKPIEEFQPGLFNWSYGRALEINEEELQRFRSGFAEVAGFMEGLETYVFYKENHYQNTAPSVLPLSQTKSNGARGTIAD